MSLQSLRIVHALIVASVLGVGCGLPSSADDEQDPAIISEWAMSICNVTKQFDREVTAKSTKAHLNDFNEIWEYALSATEMLSLESDKAHKELSAIPSPKGARDFQSALADQYEALRDQARSAHAELSHVETIEEVRQIGLSLIAETDRHEDKLRIEYQELSREARVSLQNLGCRWEQAASMSPS